MAVFKKKYRGFHPGSADACLLWTGRIFPVSFLILLFGFGDHTWTPMIHLLLLLYLRNLAQFRVFSARPEKFSTSSLPSQTRARESALNTFFAWAKRLSQFSDLHFYASPFLLKSSWHSLSGPSPSQLTHLAHCDGLLTRFASRSEVRRQHFPIYLKALCHLKIIFLDRVAYSWASVTFSNISVTDFFTQNFTATSIQYFAPYQT